MSTLQIQRPVIRIGVRSPCAEFVLSAPRSTSRLPNCNGLFPRFFVHFQIFLSRKPNQLTWSIFRLWFRPHVTMLEHLIQDVHLSKSRMLSGNTHAVVISRWLISIVGHGQVTYPEESGEDNKHFSYRTETDEILRWIPEWDWLFDLDVVSVIHWVPREPVGCFAASRDW